MKNVCRLAAALLVAGSVAGAANAALVINFPDFSNCSTLQVNGNAACVSNVLRVTPANFGQSGSAFSQTIVPLGTGNTFSTFFSFRISNNFANDNDGPGADGITFTVQPNSNTAGGAGGGIGYLGIPNSIAIEFDTWNNGVGAGDPDGNHVGVDINGSVFSVVTAPVSPRLNDGAIWYAWIDYNGSVIELRLSQANIRPAAPTLSHAVNLLSIIGQNSAYVGFTSGTGAAYSDHDILSWQFDNAFAPIGGTPAGPAAEIPALQDAMLMLVALVLGWLGVRHLQRRER